MVAVVGGLAHGVACNLDLGSLMVPRSVSPPRSGLERLGLKPFLPTEMLLAADGTVAPQYHHDLEAIIWSMVWWLKERPDWASFTFAFCFTARLKWTKNQEYSEPPVGLHEDRKVLWPKIRSAAQKFFQHSMIGNIETPQEALQIVHEFLPCPLPEGSKWFSYEFADVEIREGDARTGTLQSSD